MHHIPWYLDSTADPQSKDSLLFLEKKLQRLHGSSCAEPDRSDQFQGEALLPDGFIIQKLFPKIKKFREAGSSLDSLKQLFTEVTVPAP